jgi:hypothetical protein
VLVHHADARRDRVVRAGELDGLVVEEDLAVGRPVQAVEDVDERRLARPVLRGRARAGS